MTKTIDLSAGLPSVLTDDNVQVPILGVIMTWSLSSLAVPRTDLIKAWTDAGFDDKYIPKEIRMRSRVLRVLKEMELNGFARRIKETVDEAAWALVAEKIDQANLNIDFNVEDRLVYNKKDKTVTVTDPAFQPTVDALLDQFGDRFLTNDIRGMVLDAVKDAGGIAWRDNGGVYFIPASRLWVVNALQKFLDAFPKSGSYVRRLNLVNTPDDRKGVQSAFNGDLDSNIAQITRKLDELEGKVLVGGEVLVRVEPNGEVTLLGPVDDQDFETKEVGAPDKLIVTMGGATFELMVLNRLDPMKVQVSNAPRKAVEGTFFVKREVTSATRMSTWHNRQKEVLAERQKLAMYTDLLKFRGDVYEKKLAEIEDRIKQNLLG
jgi:hypothetical protein